LTRRQFKDGQLQNDLAPWAAAVVKVAAEEKVPVVDLNALSVRAVEEMGPTKSQWTGASGAPGRSSGCGGDGYNNSRAERGGGSVGPGKRG
jgi:hypothetical protein